MNTISHSATGPRPRPPQFSLATLLKVVTALGVLFGVMATVGAVWAWAVVLLVLLVAGHVGGNALGTQLRKETARELQEARALRMPLSASAQDSRRPRGSPEGAPTHLQRRYSLGWLIPLACGLGAVACAALASLLFTADGGPHLSYAAMYLAVASAAVIGGIGGFLAASFCRAASLALGEASHPARPKSVARPPGS